MLKLDGSKLEGGGQILRNSVALSALLGRPIEINNIRANRSKPGLKAQHLAGIELVARMCRGELKQAALHSKQIQLTPGKLANDGTGAAQQFAADPGTAGSICLLIQVALPVALLGLHCSPVSLELKGGTNASMAPQLDYLTMVLQPVLLERFGIEFEVDVIRRGFYPRGQGHVVVRTPGGLTLPLPALHMVDRGHAPSSHGLAYSAGSLPQHVGPRLAKRAQTLLDRAAADGRLCDEASPAPSVTSETVHWTNCVGAGCGIIVVLTTSTGCRLAGSALGERGVPADRVAQQAVDELLRHWALGGCTDEYLQDQLIVFMALAEGHSSLLIGGEPSLHTTTAMDFAQTICGAPFTVEPGAKKGTFLLQCDGIGFGK